MRTASLSLTFALVLLIATCAPHALAFDTVENASRQHPERIGLVLGGGGARGAAHIGVLRLLERERIPVHHIAGTSMGAIVGGLYAAGYTPDEIEAVLASVDWKDLFDDDPGRVDKPMRRKEDDLRFLLDFKLGLREGRIQLPRGVVQGQKLMLLLRRLLLSTGDVEHFDQLPIPFRCVGTDIGAGESVVFEDGDLATAIRSSMSVPAAFAPIRVRGRLMVDGGIMDNVPVDVARGMGADRLIVVDVGEPPLQESELNSPIAITMQMITVLMQARTDASLSGLGERDVLIRPSLSIGSTDFDRALQAVPDGEAAAQAQLERLRELALPASDYAAWRAARSRRAFDPPLVAFLDVLKHRSTTATYVENQLAGSAGQPLDLDRLERDIGTAFGYGAYERITWRLTEKDGETGLEVLPVDKGWGPNYLTFGLRLSDDFAGRSTYQLQAEATMTGLNSRGAEWRSRLGLGEISGLRSELYLPWGRVGQFYAMPYADYQAFEQPIAFANLQFAEYRLSRLAAGVETGWNPSPIWQMRAGIERGREAARLRIGDTGIFPRRFVEHYGLVQLGASRDTLDSVAFPSEGSRLDLNLGLYRAALGSASSGEMAELQWDKALSRGNSRLLYGLRLHSSWGQPEVLHSNRSLGGFTNLSGYGEREVFGPHSALLRTIYYRRFGDASRLFSVPVYVGASAEAGNAWPDRRQITLDSLILSGSLFAGVQTPLGPVFLAYGHADTGASAWYLNFGSFLRARR